MKSAFARYLERMRAVLSIETMLLGLPISNHDVRFELLRKRHLLLGRDPNATDKQLDEKYYQYVLKNAPSPVTGASSPIVETENHE